MDKLSDRLKRRRKEVKKTQLEVANILGVDHTTISKWENGIYEPDAITLRKIAELYDVTSDYLLGLTDDPKGNITNDQAKNAVMEIYARLPRDKQRIIDDMIRALDQQH